MEHSYTAGANYDGTDMRVGIVCSRFNGKIVESMFEAAYQTLIDNNVNENEIIDIYVPGAFELPITCKTMANSGFFDGIIALGCVIRGDTPHFDYVCRGATDGIQMAALETLIPIAFGVLTTDTLKQAEKRSSTSKIENNKGHDAALCILEMVNVLNTFKT